jgi:hypothetical protein
MSYLRSIFLYQTYDGRPLRQGALLVTPRSQVIGLRLPFLSLIWNRPVGVWVQAEQSETGQFQPIVDVTRLIQWGLYGLLFLLLLANRSRILKVRRDKQHPTAHHI